MPSSAHRLTHAHSGFAQLLHRLHSIKFGSHSGDPHQQRMPAKAIGNFFDMLALLLENGLSLRRALMTLSSEGTLKKHRAMLREICMRVDSGEQFSDSLARFPKAFTPVTVKQLRIAERSGMVVEALRRIATQLEYKKNLQTRVVKQLSYPALVVLAGTGLICFMMLFVVPQFEVMYAESNVTLPAITRFVSATSRFLFRYGWIVAGLGIAAVVTAIKMRRKSKWGVQIDQLLLRIPLFGGLLRDAAVLQFVDAVSAMIESGFVPVDAIADSVDAVTNRAVRESVRSVRNAVVRGEKLSDELARHPEIFPVTVSQLIFVGEQTGSLPRAARSVRDHLCQRIENRVNAIVSALEPSLTISLAITIGVVVLAIYMPMFSMFEVLE